MYYQLRHIFKYVYTARIDDAQQYFRYTSKTYNSYLPNFYAYESHLRHMCITYLQAT